jgi:hypothetical protein
VVIGSVGSARQNRISVEALGQQAEAFWSPLRLALLGPRRLTLDVAYFSNAGSLCPLIVCLHYKNIGSSADAQAPRGFPYFVSRHGGEEQRLGEWIGRGERGGRKHGYGD